MLPFKTIFAIRLFWAAFLLCTVVAGCAAPRPAPTVAEDKPFRKLAEKYRSKALVCEERADAPKALLYWRIVDQLNPGDREAEGKIRDLLAEIKAKADQHFQKGVELLRKNEGQAARKEFLLALAYNIEHRPALDYFRKSLLDQDYLYYTTKDGDTLRKIAEEKYSDPHKEFLVAYFNDLGNGKGSGSLPPGLVLKLPLIDTHTSGRSGYSEKNKVKLSQKISRVPEESAPRQTAEPEYSLQLQREAEEHYKKGVGFFLADELEKAAQEWKQTLRLNPSHPKAKKDLEKAQHLLEQLKKFR